MTLTLMLPHLALYMHTEELLHWSSLQRKRYGPVSSNDSNYEKRLKSHDPRTNQERVMRVCGKRLPAVCAKRRERTLLSRKCILPGD
jgi:hypothetical protein